MALEVSCKGLYFLPDSRDNVITLTWNPLETALEPNTSVIFKVKCTAPQGFHVLPRYGALLLADATGAPVELSRKETEIIFGLRDQSSDGAEGNGTNPSAMNRTPASTVSNRGSHGAAGSTPGSVPYQERFAIEYVMIKAEPLAFQQIYNSMADHAKLTEVVKSMWSLVASAAIPRAHLGVQASVALKGYTENVVLRSEDPAPNGDASTKVVVPPEARLVTPSTVERMSRNTAAAAARSRNSEGGSALKSPSSPNRRRGGEELRALKDEINSLRRDSGSSSPSNRMTPQNTTQQSLETSPSVRKSPGPATKSVLANTSVLAAAPVDESLIMQFDIAGVQGKQKKGLKVSMVVAMMCVLYVMLLWMRRGAGSHEDEAERVALVPVESA